MLNEGWRRVACGNARPLHRPERVRDKCFLIARTVNNDRHQERTFDRHQLGPIDCESPFEPKIALEPLLRILGNNRNEQGAVADLLPNLPVPNISAAQLALVEPDFDSACP
jgi:hypothetical protein